MPAYAVNESNFQGALERKENDINSNAVLSEQQRNILEEKHRLFSEFEKSTISTRGSSNTWSTLGTFTIYIQETNYYCGPACVKSVLNFINGSSPLQFIVALGCNTTTSGTYLADMISYLNSKQTVNVYEGAYQETQTKLARYLYFDINTRGIPCIIGFACSTENGWQYSSNGHFSCVVAARDDRGAFILADPLPGYLGYGVGGYVKTIDELFYAYNSVNIGFCW